MAKDPKPEAPEAVLDNLTGEPITGRNYGRQGTEHQLSDDVRVIVIFTHGNLSNRADIGRSGMVKALESVIEDLDRLD